MNELFDKLILRFLFTAVLCLSIFLYKYAHGLLYPSARSQMFKKFFPSKNSGDTLHFFSRIVGFGIIFSQFHFNLDNGLTFAITDFFIRSTLIFTLYLGAIYIIESIVLYNFEYQDEILKRKNISYALIAFCHAIGIAHVLKIILKASGSSIVVLFFLWLFSMVLIGFACKTYSLMSKLSFNKLLIQKCLAVGSSYFGFFIGWTLIIGSALDHELDNIKWYTIQVVLKILLSLIILPIFINCLKWIFKLVDDFEEVKKVSVKNGGQDYEPIDTGYGIYEGSLFLTSCFLTVVITGQIHFGTFYPIF